MADITSKDTNLKELRQRASELASAVESLATSFKNEATRMKRNYEITRLRELYSAILQRMEQVRDIERAVSYGYSKARVATSFLQLGVGLIAMTSENRMIQAISRELLAGSRSREPPYGTVLVSIGPKGLSEDVEVVSISSLARESKQDESEVIDRLVASGNLLFGEKSFSRLIDRLTGEILKGRLSMPVSAERLAQLQESQVLRLNPKNKD